jgi:IS4 transposase
MSPQGTGPGPVLLPGYRVKILDGKHLDGTEHRLRETRALHSAPLPGHLLVVLDPERRLALDAFPCEDAYAQERQLLPQVLQTVQAKDVWVADRNFCTTGFFFGVHRREAFFVIRQHGSTLANKTLVGDKRFVGRCKTGQVFEQSLQVTDPQSGETLVLRRITVELDKPTRDGDKVIHVLTNLCDQIDAITLAMLYLERWQIENLFGELAQAFDAEIDTLCYPAAALLAYCIALMTYNLQSTLLGALHQTHGDRAQIQRLSSYYLADEIASTWRGMHIAIAQKHWHKTFGDLSSERMAQILSELATRVRVEQFLKTTRGPRNPPVPRKGGLREKHVSTQRLLDKRENTRTKR